jgi:hypothetical protein
VCRVGALSGTRCFARAGAAVDLFCAVAVGAAAGASAAAGGGFWWTSVQVPMSATALPTSEAIFTAAFFPSITRILRVQYRR